MTDDRHTYTPNMEKLKADLGRTPPSMVDQSKPDDFAPRTKPLPTPDVAGGRQIYVSPDWEMELSQRIKALMRESDDWERLSYSAREGLDRIVSRIAGICVGRDYWAEIMQHATDVTNQEP